MSTIRVERTHSLSVEEALQRARDLVNEFASKLKADVTWNGPQASFKGTGFSGSAKVTGSQVAVDVDLNLVLRAMRSKIETRLEKALSEKFA